MKSRTRETDKLIEAIIARFYDGSQVAMADDLNIKHPRLGHYLYKRRVYNKAFVNLLYKKYSRAYRSDGIPADLFMKLLGE